ncbi:cupin domain-containing protein [Thioclava sp. FTW29]|uniref:Cupin domain-containing protein n=1 Tax=Thioclava litoralis TaxID=3076557 RepID=A0ABZ1E2X8_9RHOB|nr:cupin domain-containing protein [Thioclava sp. FTW29]
MKDLTSTPETTATPSVKQIALAKADYWSIIEKLMPQQGCIEVQQDAPGKEHAWHQHPTDETLVVLEGQARFYWEGGEQICGAGAVISLPAGVRHGSVALDEGVRYLISFHAVELADHG